MISLRCFVLKAEELSNALWFKGFFCLFVLDFPIQLPNTSWLSLQNKLILLRSSNLHKYRSNFWGMNQWGKCDWKTSSRLFAPEVEHGVLPWGTALSRSKEWGRETGASWTVTVAKNSIVHSSPFCHFLAGKWLNFCRSSAGWFQFHCWEGRGTARRFVVCSWAASLKFSLS